MIDILWAIGNIIYNLMWLVVIVGALLMTGALKIKWRQQ